MTKIFENFDAQSRALWGENIVRLRHTLDQRAMFTDEKLGQLLDSIPETRMAINTMAAKGMTFPPGRIATRDLSGAQLINAVRQGRIWINVTKIHDFVPEYAELLDEIFRRDRDERARPRRLPRSMGLLISSPNAQVY